MTTPNAGDRVRLIIARLDTAQPALVPQILRKVETTSTGLVNAAAGCAREFVTSEHLDPLVGAIKRTFSTAPDSGYAAIINRRSGLMLVALWPCAPITSLSNL